MTLSRQVGQVGNLRPIVNRPAAGPSKFFGSPQTAPLKTKLDQQVGQVGNLRPIVNRPAAGPSEFVGTPQTAPLKTKLDQQVGQVGNLRPIVNRPAAGKSEFLGRLNQSSINWIELDIPNDAPKLGCIANGSVIRLVLPKGLTGEVEDSVRLTRGMSFERLRQLRYGYLGSN